MSQTTTAAGSYRGTPLTFGGWLANTLPEPAGPLELPPPPVDGSPRLNVEALCRRTFVHLETASPLAKLSRASLIRSFRDFSSQLEGREEDTGAVNRRRHTLTQVVVDDDEADTVKVQVRPSTENVDCCTETAVSPIARLSTRHTRTFDRVWKDDSFAPNLKRCPSDAFQDRNALLESRDLSRSMSEALLDPMPPDTSTRSGRNVERLAPLPELSTSLSSPEHSHTSTGAATPTPIVKYIDGLFLPIREQIDHDELEKISPIFNRAASPDQPAATAEDPATTTIGPDADLLTSPWTDNDALQTTAADTPPGSASFSLADWAGRLTEVDLTCNITTTNEVSPPTIDELQIVRGSLSDFLAAGSTTTLTNVFAAPVAQPLLVAAGDPSKRKASSDTGTKAEDAVPGDARSGHPTSCKPCAFFWSKGCLNGDDCRFCHDWHAPKKKKPMKDQKNLMIIAKEDGKIAFLRCAIEDALKH